MQLAAYHAKASASQTAGERFSKIKRNIEKSKAKEAAIAEDEEMEERGESSDDEDEQSVLLYKDNSDGEERQITEEQLLYGEEDESSSDFDEEIERIPMAGEAKRQRREEGESDDDLYGD